MDINLDRRARGYSARRRRNRIWKKLVTALGCLVVFCTTYALILPAITMEREPVCGLSEHVHSDSCYSRQRGALTCTLAESEGHTHTDACKGTKRVLSCTTPESDGHTHGEGCYDAEGVLTCTLPETQGHHHSDSCYRTEEVFVCGKAESAPHHHTDECYAWETVATCGSQEHTHTDSCYPTKPAETTGATEMPTASTTDATTAATENTETAEPMEEMLLLQEEVMALSAEGTEPLPNVKIKATSTPQASYDPTVDKFKTTIQIDFTIPGSAFSNTTIYTYDYPEGIEIPESLLNQDHKMEDGRGTYRFEKVGDVYQLSVILSDVVGGQDNVTGFVNFNGTLDATKVHEDGRIVLGGEENQLIIDSDKIDYPKGETEKYDISASKWTDGNIDNGKLTYYVTISTKKGTPNPIQFTDTIQTDGLKLGTPVVKVNGQVHQANWTRNAETGTGTITMDNLPGLNAGQNYEIEYTYDVTDYPAAVMNPNNTLTVKAKDEGRKQEVTDEKKVSTRIDKRHTAAKVGKLEGSRIQWTITLNSNRSNITGATLTDVMFKNLSADSNITVSPNNGYTLQGETITFSKVDGKENNQRYTITYYTDAPADENVKEVINKAKFDPNPDDPKDDIEMEEKVGVGIDAAKSGKYNASEGTITWVITVNAKNRNIAGAVLTDDMLSQAIAGTIQVTPTSGYVLNKDADGKVSITFQQVNGEANTNTYKITYTTAASPALVARTVSNTAHLKKGEHEEEVTAEVTIDSGGSVDKSSGTLTLSEDKTTGVLPWTVTIHVPAGGIPANTQLVDMMGKDSGENVYMTNVQVKAAVEAFCQALNIQPQDVEVKIESGIHWSPNYDYKLIDSYTNVQFRKLTLTLLKDVPTNGQTQDITVTYNTTLTIDPAKMNQVYSNYFKAGEKESSAQFEYWRSGVEKTDNRGNKGTSTVSSQGDLVWKVIVTLDDTSRQFLDITDTLPADVTLADLKLIRPIDQWNDSTASMTIGEDGAVSGQNGLYQVNGTYNKTTGEVSLKVTALNGGDLPTRTKLTFVFGCQTALTDKDTHTFNNKVDVKGIGSASQTQNWTYDNQDTETAVLGKTGTWNNHSRTLSYKVDINPNSKKLSEPDGTGKLTLVDTLSYSKKVSVWVPSKGTTSQFAMDVSLVQNSVKLYRVTKNEDGTTTETLLSVPWTFEEQLGDGEWGKNNCILRMDVPDGTHLRLEYQYQVEVNAPEEGICDKLPIENTVALEGTGYKKEADNFPRKWEESKTSGQVTSGRTLLIYKVARGDFGTVLPGAEFTVYTVDTSYNLNEYTARPDGSAFSNPMVTDESGRLTIRIQDKAGTSLNFDYDTLYALQETKAPPGYRLPDEPQVFYFYFSDPDSAARAIPQNLPAGAMDLSQTDQQKFVENEPVPTYELPDTGGGGTRGFSLGGALVTVGGLYLLTRKKRRRRDA